MAEQRTVLEAGSLQVQQADELLLNAIDNRIRRPGGLGERSGVVDLREITGVRDRNNLQAPGAGRQLRYGQADEQEQDGGRDIR